MSDVKPFNKDAQQLQDELIHFLATPHGKIDQAAEKIAKALEKLLAKENMQNKALFEMAVKQAIIIPSSDYFKSADKTVQRTMLNILEHAKEILDRGLNDLTTLNEQIKQEKKKLKERIEKIKKDDQQRSRGPGR